jgi:DNA repair protein RadC
MEAAMSETLLPPPALPSGAFVPSDALPKPVGQRRGMAGYYKLMKLRDCPVPTTAPTDTPQKVADFWRANIPQVDWFNPNAECFVVIYLNTRRFITGWHLVSIGTLDTILVHPREVFGTAIVAGAAAVVCVHNHPSGDPTPSEADIKVTRDLIRAGQLLKVEVLDHIVIGKEAPDQKGYQSLRELGYFYS